MGNLIVKNFSTSLWYEIVHDAQATCMVTLRQELEAYLVHVLTKYLAKADFTQRTMAIDFLQAMQQKLPKRCQGLSEVGDQCLLLSGLFPGCSDRRLVKISYFVHLGQSAYALAAAYNVLYKSLAKEFTHLMDVLQSIRASNDKLSPLQAYELWTDTGSLRALQQLQLYTQAIPGSWPAK